MLSADDFAALMAPLGPFTDDRRVAVAVSGGADSLALAMLTAGWGRPLALVVDHGLRPAAADEAALTMRRLVRHGIPARLITLRMSRGPGLAARARTERYAALTEACRAAGLPQLLLGHHAGDQAETVLMRALHGSGPDGRAGMAALQVAGGVMLLRPLLGVAQGRLRDGLRMAGVDWVEDPSNHDPTAERVRLRALIGELGGDGPRTAGLAAAGRHWRWRRADRAAATRAWLVAHAVLYPALHVELPDTPMPPEALSALIQTVTGSAYPPPEAAVRRLAAAPAPATLAGARLVRGRGRLHIAREAAAMAAAVPAVETITWDGRFRLALTADGGAGATLGALGESAAAFRRHADWPAAVLATLPCLRRAGAVIAVPHLGIGDPDWQLLPVVNRAATSPVLNCASPM